MTGICLSASAQSVVLDLKSASVPQEFNAENGMWTGTYDDSCTAIECGGFRLMHGSMREYQTWWGFTLSTSADNSRREDTMTFQFSNMAKGGVAVDATGAAVVDANGAVTTDAARPYLVGFGNDMFGTGEHPASVTYGEGETMSPVGIYVNMNAYPYYCVEQGDAFARAFGNGDRYCLVIHGAGKDGEKRVEVPMASYADGDLTVNRGWKYVDLKALGEVNELWFTTTTTDVGQWGDNTPSYFCLDRLEVTPGQSGVRDVQAGGMGLRYDRNGAVLRAEGAEYLRVYDSAGVCVCAVEGSEADLSGLRAGVYVARAGGESLTFMR